MAEARARSEWAQTSSMMALVANVNRNPRRRRRPYRPDDFNPFAQGSREGIALTPENIGLLKGLVAGRRRP